MRQLKFRAWDIANNEMIKHDFIIIGQNGLVFISDESNSRDYIIIQEFIGIKDKKGMEIFEGDLFMSNRGQLNEVKFIDGGFRRVQIKHPYTYTPSLLIEADIERFEIDIIGNIYETPKLIDQYQKRIPYISSHPKIDLGIINH